MGSDRKYSGRAIELETICIYGRSAMKKGHNSDHVSQLYFTYI